MNSIAKIIIFTAGLAIILPILYSGKLLRWLPPYGTDPANLFQSAGAQLARWSASLQKNNAVEPAQTPSAADTAPEPPIAAKFTPPEKPYRILLVGDSFVAVAGGFGDIAEKELVGFSDVTVLRQGKVSSGLSRPDFYDWHQAAKKTIAEFKPNVAIIMMGTNDAQSFEVVENQKKQVINFGTNEWDRRYQSRAELFIKEFTDRGSIVYWIGLPAMRVGAYDAKIKRLSKLQEAAVKNNSQAKFISSTELMSDGQTAYQPFMPDKNGIMRATRNPDGTHLSYFGGTLLVEKILEKLKQDLNLSLPVQTQPSTVTTQNPAQ
ncbi:MAG: DUF459 domain-containing protein [Candidatus Paceibacterota bacterium]